MQIISLYSRVSYSWPTEVLYFIRITSILNFEMELCSPTCSVPISYWGYYKMQMLAPIVFLGCLSLVIIALDLRLRRKRKLEGLPYPDPDTPDLISRAIYIIVFIFSNMYTFLATKVLLGILECFKQPDGTYTMLLNPSERCNEGSWADNKPFVILFSVLYLGIAPFSIVLIFLKNRSSVASTRKFLWRYGALVRPYITNMFFWELIATVKKTVFVVLVKVLASLTVYARLLHLTFFLIIFMVTENVCLPSKTHRLNALWNSVAVFLLLSNALIFEPQSIGTAGLVVVAVLVIRCHHRLLLSRCFGPVL